MYFVYILISQKDNKRYIGSTNYLQRRLYYHNLGLVRSTKGRRPLIMLGFEQYDIEKEARARERFLKTHKGYIELKKKYGLWYNGITHAWGACNPGSIPGSPTK